MSNQRSSGETLSRSCAISARAPSVADIIDCLMHHVPWKFEWHHVSDDVVQRVAAWP